MYYYYYYYFAISTNPSISINNLSSTGLSRVLLVLLGLRPARPLFNSCSAELRNFVLLLLLLFLPYQTPYLASTGPLACRDFSSTALSPRVLAPYSIIPQSCGILCCCRFFAISNPLSREYGPSRVPGFANMPPTNSAAAKYRVRASRVFWSDSDYGQWGWPEKSRIDCKSAGALFWHLNWPDHPEVYIKGRVRPEKKNTPKMAVRCHFGPYLFDLGSGC